MDELKILEELIIDSSSDVAKAVRVARVARRARVGWLKGIAAQRIIGKLPPIDT